MEKATMKNRYSDLASERYLLSLFYVYPAYIPDAITIEAEDFEGEKERTIIGKILDYRKQGKAFSKSDLDSAELALYISKLLESEDSVYKYYNDPTPEEIEEDAHDYSNVVRYNRIRREMDRLITSKENDPQRMRELWSQLDEIYDRKERGFQLYQLDFYKGLDRLRDLCPQKASAAEISQHLEISINTVRNWTKPAFRVKNKDYLPNWSTIYKLLEYFQEETKGSLDYLLNGFDYSKHNINLNYKLQLEKESIDILQQLAEHKNSFHFTPNMTVGEMLEYVVSMPAFTNEFLALLKKYYEDLLQYSIRAGNVKLEEWIMYSSISAKIRADLRKSIEENSDKLLEEIRKSKLPPQVTDIGQKKMCFRRGLRRAMKAGNMTAAELSLRIAESDSTIRSWLQPAIKDKTIKDLLAFPDSELLNQISGSEEKELRAIKLAIDHFKYSDVNSIRDFLSRYLNGNTEEDTSQYEKETEYLDEVLADLGVFQSIPSAKTIRHICIVFNRDIDYLFGISDFEWEENRYIAEKMGFTSEKTIRWFRNLNSMDSNNIEYILKNYTYSADGEAELFVQILEKMVKLQTCYTLSATLKNSDLSYGDLKRLQRLHEDIISEYKRTCPYAVSLYQSNWPLSRKQSGLFFSHTGTVYSKDRIRSQFEVLNHIIAHWEFQIKEQFTDLFFDVLKHIDEYLCSPELE